MLGNESGRWVRSAFAELAQDDATCSTERGLETVLYTDVHYRGVSWEARRGALGTLLADPDTNSKPVESHTHHLALVRWHLIRCPIVMHHHILAGFLQLFQQKFGSTLDSAR